MIYRNERGDFLYIATKNPGYVKSDIGNFVIPRMLRDSEKIGLQLIYRTFRGVWTKRYPNDNHFKLHHMEYFVKEDVEPIMDEICRRILYNKDLRLCLPENEKEEFRKEIEETIYNIGDFGFELGHSLGGWEKGIYIETRLNIAMEEAEERDRERAIWEAKSVWGKTKHILNSIHNEVWQPGKTAPNLKEGFFVWFIIWIFGTILFFPAIILVPLMWVLWRSCEIDKWHKYD